MHKFMQIFKKRLTESPSDNIIYNTMFYCVAHDPRRALKGKYGYQQKRGKRSGLYAAV